MSEGGEFTPIETQEDFDRAIRARLKREREKAREEFADYDELKEKAGKYDEAAGEVERLKGEAEKREKADELRKLRARVSKATGVPVDVIETLSGSDEETLTSQAEAMAKWAKPRSGAHVPRPGSFDSRGGGDDALTAAKRKLAAQMFGTKEEDE